MIKSTENCDLPSKSNEYYRELIQIAIDRVEHGFAPPPEIYRLQRRYKIDWSVFPEWARPIDPEVFDGCCHEG